MLTLRELCANTYLRTFGFTRDNATPDAYEKFGILSQLLGIRTDGRGASVLISNLFKTALIHDKNTLVNKLNRPLFATALGNPTYLDFRRTRPHYSNFKFELMMKILHVMYAKYPPEGRNLHTLALPYFITIKRIQKILANFPRLQSLVVPIRKIDKLCQIPKILTAFPTLSIKIKYTFSKGYSGKDRTALVEMTNELQRLKIPASRLELPFKFFKNATGESELFENPYVKSIAWALPENRNEFTLPSYPDFQKSLGLGTTITNIQKLNSLLTITNEKTFFKHRHFNSIRIYNIPDFNQDQLNAILKLPLKELFIDTSPLIRSIISTKLSSLHARNLGLLQVVKLSHSEVELDIVDCPMLTELYIPSSNKVHINGCGRLESFDVDASYKITIQACLAMKSISCGKVTRLGVDGCLNLKTLSAPSVATFNGFILPSIETLSFPLASTIELSSCQQLKTISAEKATKLTLGHCDALAYINSTRLFQMPLKAWPCSVSIDLSPAASSSVDQGES